ncbi:MAG: hypothetical protein AABO57_06145 [Acidobacteriota bacterium]
MNDDYLWDRSGEPDLEVERLERVLGKYRYQPQQLSPVLDSRLFNRRTGWIRLAAAAAAILMVLAGLWIFKVQNRGIIDPPGLSSNDDRPAERRDKPQDLLATVKEPEHLPSAATTVRAPRKSHRRPSEERFVESLPVVDSSSIAERRPLINPFIDVETARHIERAQLLLRSFRNTRDNTRNSGSRPGADLSYERQGSRELLYKNVLLRRDAEAKGNMPVEDLLGGLEPFLLDIANLSDRPSGDDVRSIKERMQKKEIISALQIYSAPTLSQVF